MKPPGFDPAKQYPVLSSCHGGPQGAWGESWSYRWNPQIFASAGYLVVMPNPRGSTGYGQRFTDEVSADWGGRAYLDIMAVVDHVANLPYADANRMGAAGASYGGYMVNWILGNPTRFKALVSRAGVYDLESMFGETEELWFHPLGSWRHALANPEYLPPVVAQQACGVLRNAHPGHRQRVATTGCRSARAFSFTRRCKMRSGTLEADPLPRGRPLDPEAAKQRVLVSKRHRVAG
ncbi:MAG: prolyl oligopeptidase family serine peptidase [Bryobacterales bacterium]|nr:prolyl oligopeptidase family serine peptidase [Bryobacterales bacterium]